MDTRRFSCLKHILALCRMVHSILDEPLTHAVDDLPEDAGLHDGEGDDVSPHLHTLPDLSVGEPHHTDPVDLNNLLVCQETVPGGGAADSNGSHRPGLHLDPQPPRPVLVEQETPGQGSVPHAQHDVVDRGAPQGVCLEKIFQTLS